MATFIHPTAIVDSKAEIGSNVTIGPFCTVGPNVKIGDNTKLMSHVVLDGWTTLGSDNTIFPFSVLGAVPQDLKYKGEETYLIIGDRNTIRESVTLNLGTVQGGGKTQIGSDNLIMAYVHMGHDCIVGSHCIIANSVNLAGHVVVHDFANIGGMVGVSQFLRIGSYTYIGGMSSIDRDVPHFVVALGERPCEIKGANIVGLRRRGFPADSINRINDSIKLWKRPDVTKDQCLLEIDSQYGEYPEVKDFISFIKSSESGCIK